MLVLACFLLTKLPLKRLLAVCSYLLVGVAVIFVLLFYVKKETFYSYVFFSSSLNSIRAFLIFPLLQLFYLTVKKDLRYKVKAWVEVFFFLPVLTLLKSVPTIGLMFFPETFGENSYYFLIVPIVLIFVLVCLARRTSSEDQAP